MEFLRLLFFIFNLSIYACALSQWPLSQYHILQPFYSYTLRIWYMHHLSFICSLHPLYKTHSTIITSAPLHTGQTP